MTGCNAIETMPEQSAFTNTANSQGLTKREFFACQMLSAMAVGDLDGVVFSDLAKDAVTLADELIKALRVGEEV